MASLYLCVYIRSSAVAFSLHLVFGTHNLIIFLVFWLVTGIHLSFVGRYNVRDQNGAVVDTMLPFLSMLRVVMSVFWRLRYGWLIVVVLLGVRGLGVIITRLVVFILDDKKNWEEEKVHKVGGIL